MNGFIANNECQIRFDPNYTKDGINYIKVFLYLVKSNASIIRVKYSVCVKDINNEDINKFVTNLSEYTADDSGWGFHHFIKRDYLLLNKNELLPNNVLTLCLVIEVIEKIS